MRKIIPVILLIALGFICYFNILRAEFIWDDFMLIVSNDAIKSFSNVGNIIVSELLPNTDYYRPLQAISYVIDYCIYGLNPLGFHLTNIILFILNSILVYFLFKSITKSKFIAIIGSLLFACAPFYSESVSYVSGRADLLLGLFILSALIAYVKERYNLCIFLFVFSLLAKELAIIFPLALIIYDTVFKKFKSLKIKTYILLFVIELLYILLRLFVVHFEKGTLLARKLYFYNEISLYERLLTFFKSLVIYLKVIIFPVNLHMERTISTVKSIFDWHIVVLFFALILFIYLLKKIKNDRQIIVFGFLSFIIMLLPQSSFTLPLILAEHFLYLPAIGLFLILATLLNNIRQSRKLFVAIFSISLVIYYSSLTIASNYNWQNMFSFLRWTLKYSPSSYRLRYFLGIKYAENGFIDLAIDEFRKGMDLDKNFEINSLNLDELNKLYKNEKESHLLSKFRHNLASVLSQKGFFNHALVQYKLAIESNPNFIEAYNDLGCLYLKLGRLDEAIVALDQALRINPSFAKAYYNLGVVYAEKRKDDKAIFFWKKALDIDPKYDLAKSAIKKIKEEQK